MKDEEVGKLVGTLADHYGVTPDDEMVDLWWNSYHETAQSVIDDALADCLANENYMPKVAKFREYVDKHSRIARRVEPRRFGCQTCPGDGWVESTQQETATGKRPTKVPDGKMDGPMESYEFTYPPGVYPCPACERARYDRWHDQWVPEANRNRNLQPKAPDLLPANPRKGLASARAMLAAADNLTRSTEDL